MSSARTRARHARLAGRVTRLGLGCELVLRRRRRGGERRERRELGPEVVTFENIWKAFGPNEIYRGLDLTVHKGETLTIVGGSGTGKSVLLKCLLQCSL